MENYKYMVYDPSVGISEPQQREIPLSNELVKLIEKGLTDVFKNTEYQITSALIMPALDGVAFSVIKNIDGQLHHINRIELKIKNK